MRYRVLLLNVSNNLHHALTHRLQGMDVDFTLASSYQNLVRLCAEHSFHLIVLHFPDTALCNEFLIALRRVSYTPTVVLLDQYDAESACSVLESGADLCIETEWPVDLTADHIMAQFRRFAAYAHDKNAQGHDFQVGDIYIDPLRRVVRVKERSVRLRPREFELLLYFMQHPDMVLTPQKICKGAWGMDYTESVGRSVYELRKKIEADPSKSCYIKTIYRIGYRFTGHLSEICDN
ncbi:MAG: response regulator transcription factor [Oscillibacter sp.]|nr:response regulator transcription factor [Oscillibacter sp.]